MRSFRLFSCLRSGQTYLLNLSISIPVLYMIASRIIAKMASPQTSRFLALPSELRRLIYEKLFANTQLVIEDGKVIPGTQRNHGAISNTKNNAALIAACRQIRAEAQLAMYSCTTVTFRGSHGPDRVQLQNDLRRRVKRIIFDNGLRANEILLVAWGYPRPPTRSIGGFTMSALLPYRSLQVVEIAEFDVDAASPRSRNEIAPELGTNNSPFNQWLLGVAATQLLVPNPAFRWPVTLSSYRKIKNLPYEYHETAAANTSKTHRRFRIVLHVYCHVRDVNAFLIHQVRFVKSVPCCVSMLLTAL